jgi:hypothetical protein
MSFEPACSQMPSPLLDGIRLTLKCRMRRRSCATTEKQYSTPKLRVGTVKKSIASDQLCIQRETVRSERSKPSICNPPWMRGAPQVGLSANVRKMCSRTSLLTRFLPVLI